MAIDEVYSETFPLLPTALLAPSIDIFGLDDILFPLTSDLFSAPADGEEFSAYYELDSSEGGNPGNDPERYWGDRVVAEDAPAGFYLLSLTEPIHYTFGSTAQFSEPDSHSGNRNLMRIDDFREFNGGRNITYGPWLRLQEDNYLMIRIGGPAFIPQGARSGVEALQISAGASYFFYHPGGVIEAGFDDDRMSDNVGVLKFRIDRIPALLGAGRWQIRWASNPPPKEPRIVRGTEENVSPELTNLWPGHFVLRYLVVSGDGRRRTQDFNVRIWEAKPRSASSSWVVNLPGGAGEASRDDYRRFRYQGERKHEEKDDVRFPVKEPQERIPGPPGVPLQNRDKLRQPATYGGQFPERPPDDDRVYKRPDRLGDSEAF